MLTTLTANEIMTGRETLARQQDRMPLWFLFGLVAATVAMVVLYVLGVDLSTAQIL